MPHTTGIILYAANAEFKAS